MKGHGSGFRFNPGILGTVGVSLQMARMPRGPPAWAPRLHPACALTTHSFPKLLLAQASFSASMAAGLRSSAHSRNVFAFIPKQGGCPHPLTRLRREPVLAVNVNFTDSSSLLPPPTSTVPARGSCRSPPSPHSRSLWGGRS